MIFSQELISRACAANAWFTPTFVTERLQEVWKGWTHRPAPQKSMRLTHLGLVAAGNIPLVCWHDLLCVYVATPSQGVPVMLEIKLSGKDRVLLPEVWARLEQTQAAPTCLRVQFVDQLSDSVQAILFTGGQQAEAAFRAQYPGTPLLARTSRTSVAVLDGTESEAQLEGLAYDCFSFFGLGCRNVTTLWVPQAYDFSAFLRAVARATAAGGRLADLASHQGFRNAYRHARAVAQLADEPFTDGGVCLLQPSADLFPPMAVLHYSSYTSLAQVGAFLNAQAQEIQCVVGRQIAFGQAQFPLFTQYADGINTLEWLQKL